ncbi:MAG: hypothetical protein AVDCRST_MAG20-1449, partial [uncultured Acidimicrobiales bacterium]
DRRCGARRRGGGRPGRLPPGPEARSRPGRLLRRPPARHLRVGRRGGTAAPARPRRLRLRRDLRRVRPAPRRGRLPRGVVGPAQPRRLRARRPPQLGRRRARRARRARQRVAGRRARGRPLQGRRAHAPAGRRLPPPGEPPREPRRAAVEAHPTGRARHGADPPPGERPGRLARPPPERGRGDPQARHPRRAGGAAGQDEPAPADRLAPLPRHRRRQEGRRRVALEDRPEHAHGRLRALAARVVAAADAGARHALPRRARTRDRADGVGHRPRGRPSVPATRGVLRHPRGHGALRAHRAPDRGGRVDRGLPGEPPV